MKLLIATILVALLPYFASATSTSVTVGTKISLTKRNNITANGVVDVSRLQSHVGHVKRFAMYRIFGKIYALKLEERY